MIEFGDCREIMRRWAAQGIKAQTCVTSPPYYGLRDYGHDGQIGLEETPEKYIKAMVEVFRCVWDVLADDGTLWLNIGDSYARDPGKGGSGPGGKNTAYGDSYTDAARIRSEAKGSSDGKVGRGDRAPVRLGGEGIKQKDLIGIPWMLAFALRADGWYLRQDIIWHKPNPMPESVQDRCTKAHEYIFLLSKSERYYYNADAIAEPVTDSTAIRLLQDIDNQIGSDRVPNKTNGTMKAVGGKKFTSDMGGGGTTFVGHSGYTKADGSSSLKATRNKRSVWTVTTKPYKGAHFATFPSDLIKPCILAGAPAGGVVLDPFMGSGTTAAVAIANGRNYLGCELNPAYKELQDDRIRDAFLEASQMELI
jgi:DNA modification methylase